MMRQWSGGLHQCHTEERQDIFYVSRGVSVYCTEASHLRALGSVPAGLM
jgi:hypothetical protein